MVVQRRMVVDSFIFDSGIVFRTCILELDECFDWMIGDVLY